MPNIALPSERWEVGGEFHAMELPSGPLLAWPAPAVWYLLARHAVVDLLRLLGGRRRLWVPNYFCFDVSDYWSNAVEVVPYEDNPLRVGPDWSTLHPDAADVVIAVNFFGVRTPEPWRIWRESHACVLVEDHSHDPLSGWALHSAADYAFASVRKTVPVPDGAILWSPKGLRLPPAGVRENPASELKLSAMLQKREYLEGRTGPSAKSEFRNAQQQGEAEFERSIDPAFATPFTQEYVSSGVPDVWRQRRSANVHRLLSQIRSVEGLTPVFTSWPDDAAPLGAVLQFDCPVQRDRMREHLQRQKVYCPVHWPPTGSTLATAKDIAGRLLTIPADQRYSDEDIDRVAGFVIEA